MKKINFIKYFINLNFHRGYVELIRSKNLYKSFGNINAVSDISISLNVGEVIGFLGPNGAGKSTTMKMLTGFLEADSGSIEIKKIDVGSISEGILLKK